VEEGKTPGDLCFVFTNDKTILELNRRFLNHDYFTDVISFSGSYNNVISGEIYISIDTVKRNSEIYKVGISEEVLRVMIHGVLHLCGYRDDNEEIKKDMIWKQEELIERYIGRK
jgi:rRNA maturation RNase YbeY